MFDKKKKIEELEKKVRTYKKEAELADRDKKEIKNALNEAHERIRKLEKELKKAQETPKSDYSLEEIKEKVKRSAVDYEGLKELYTEKVKAFEQARESREEEFARETALKRNDLAEELQANRDENQERVRSTVNDFAGRYLYYMDQIRLMMNALNQAAAETGNTLFDGDVKERFGSSIAEHLQHDLTALKQNTRDRLLIGAADKPDAPEETYDDYPDEADRFEPDEFSVEAAEEYDMPEEYAAPETEYPNPEADPFEDGDNEPDD